MLIKLYINARAFHVMHRYLFNVLVCFCVFVSFILGKYHIIYIAPELIQHLVNIIIFCIFFTSGMMIPLDKLDSFYKYLHMVSFTLFCSFLIYPVVGVAIGYFLALLNFNRNLLLGYVMVCFLPPPISAGVILTQGINGNEPLAIVNSIVGNFVGIFLSPVLLHAFLLNALDIPQQDLLYIVLHIFCIVILPLIIGKLVAYNMDNHKPNRTEGCRDQISNFNKILLLGILFLLFLDMFQHQDWLSFGLRSVLSLVFSIILCQTLMIIVVYVLGVNFMTDSANAKDMYAIVYSSSLKSLSTGMVIIHSLLKNGSVTLSVNRAEIILPLMLFEPIQIFIGSSFQSLIIRLFKRFKNRSSSDSFQITTQP